MNRERRTVFVGFGFPDKKRQLICEILNYFKGRDIDATILEHMRGNEYPDDFDVIHFPAFFYGFPHFRETRRRFSISFLVNMLLFPITSFEAILLDYKMFCGTSKWDGSKFAKLVRVLSGFYHFSSLLREEKYLRKGDQVILFGSNNPVPRILRRFCSRKGIKILMMEHGTLGGTMHFSPTSVSNGLYPICFKEKFKKLPISSCDIEVAKKYHHEVRMRRYDQKIQAADEQLFQLLDEFKGKKVLIPASGAAGGGFYPAFSKTRKELSPWFKNYRTLVKEILPLAKKNNWMLILKPHPNSLWADYFEDLTGPVVVTHECDVPSLVERSDVVVALGTKLVHSALIYSKPVVLVGKPTLYGMGCCYDYRRRVNLESLLKMSLEEGLTKKQYCKYLSYTARELKYLLFEYDEFTIGKFGQKRTSIPALIDSYFEQESGDLSARHHALFCNRDCN